MRPSTPSIYNLSDELQANDCQIGIMLRIAHTCSHHYGRVDSHSGILLIKRKMITLFRSFPLITRVIVVHRQFLDYDVVQLLAAKRRCTEQPPAAGT